MYPFKNPPAPTNRIWAACYMDSVTECFEIRTEAKTPGGIFTLYHKEYPIGTALTEFLYADLKVFPAHLGNIKTFSATHSSSAAFSTEVGSVLHGILLPLQPDHG